MTFDLTFERGAEDFMLDALGLGLDEAGYVVTDEGEYVPAACEKSAVRIDRVGIFDHDESCPGDVRIVCDHMSCIVNYLHEPPEWDDPRDEL